MDTSLGRRRSIVIKDIGFRTKSFQLKSHFYSLLALCLGQFSYIPKPQFFPCVNEECIYLEKGY